MKLLELIEKLQSQYKEVGDVEVDVTDLYSNRKAATIYMVSNNSSILHICDNVKPIVTIETAVEPDED